MSYVKTSWVNRSVQYPRRINLSLVTATTYDYTVEAGTVTEAGTDITAIRLNNIEDGLFDSYYVSDATLAETGTASYSWSGSQLSQVQEYEGGTLFRQKVLTWSGSDLSSVNTKVYATDGVTVLRDWTTVYTFIGGILTATSTTKNV